MEGSRMLTHSLDELSEDAMKRSILMSLVLGAGVIFFSCSENTPTAPEAIQTLKAPAPEVKPAPTLTCTIEYVNVASKKIFDAAGRRLVWDGEIHGEIEGRMLWWFVKGGGPPEQSDHVVFYEARWEILVGDNLVLAGESSGTTACPPDRDGIWRGNGKVTEANGEFEGWLGRQEFECGNVVMTKPAYGEGMVRFN